MHMRPRCHEWLPLATQQLRLRNLVRIQGLNIQCSITEGKVFIYYTLHSNLESDAFYVSEALPRQYSQQKWAEINCAEILKSNANCVCIKVWAQIQGAKILNEETESVNTVPESKEPISASSTELSNACISHKNLLRPPDKLLFSWGVYFSGLIPLSQNIDAKCQANSLIFLMNGAYFASPENIAEDSLLEQLSINCNRFSASIPKVCTPQASRSSSPVTFESKEDLIHMSKARYAQLNRPKSDVRRSYNLINLLKIQDLQRAQLQLKRETQEIAADIKHLCIRCITKDQLLRKARTTSLSSSSSMHMHHHSMGRTLSVLLAEQQQVNPHTLLRAQRLEEEIETLRSRKSLLQAERTTYSKRISQFQKRLNSLTQARQEQETWLQCRYKDLQNDIELLEQYNIQKVNQQKLKRRIVHNVERRMSLLCMELREIYPIHSNSNGLHMICGIPFPDINFNDAKYAKSVTLENVSPMALSAGLGNIAHLVKMIAIIRNRPLRNRIIHEGSRTRIMDVMSREFPLFSRSSILSKAVKYAIYLLNQNVAQLCFDITGAHCDHRTTIQKIIHIFVTLESIEKNQREIHTTNTLPTDRIVVDSINSCASIDGCSVVDDSIQYGINCLSKSHSSIDMNNMNVPMASKMSLLTISSTEPIQIAERSSSQQRICRSVGSYSDSEDDLKEIVDHCYSNSDSNIPFQGEHV